MLPINKNKNKNKKAWADFNILSRKVKKVKIIKKRCRLATPICSQGEVRYALFLRRVGYCSATERIEKP